MSWLLCRSRYQGERSESSHSASIMITVKFISRLPASQWQRYFPTPEHVWGDCRFIFERETSGYDWLVVYDELAPAPGESQSSASELLACAPENTLLITTEPSSIKVYGQHYTQQFAHVLTTQPAWALPHAQRHWQQAANHWFYGGDDGNPMTYERLVQGGGSKTGMASMVGSGKAQKHTMHATRFAFMQRVQALMPELKVFGRGYRPMADKAEALDPYRYHICLENHLAPHHWTEKLADAFLGGCLPFYAGAPNAADYFPEGSFVRISMNDPEGAVALLRQAIAEDWYSQRLPLIQEARRRVLQDYHLFAVTEHIIALAGVAPPAATPVCILSRHALRKRSLAVALFHVLEKIKVRLRTWRERRCAAAESL